MKKTLNVLCAVSLIVLVLSCGNTNQPSNGGDYVPDDQLAIIKMTPDLQEHVFVSPIVDSVFRDYSDNSCTLYLGDSLVLCSPNHTDSALAEFVISRLGILGTSPYVSLEDGYAIIDWKWARFHPLSGEFRNTRNCYVNLLTNMIEGYSTNTYYLNGDLKNEEYYLLPIKWNELKDLNAMWSIDEGQHIEKPEIWYITTKDIESYGKMNMSSRELPFLDLYRIYTFYNTDEAMYQKLDMLQASYVEALKQMIKNKNFDTWKQF